jgi:hypothetical protein
MKTPMQEHIEFLKKEWLIVKNLESLGYIGVALHIGDCIEHAKSMLEKENVSNRFISISEKEPPSNIELLVQNPEGQNHLAHWRKEYSIFSCQAKGEDSFGWKWKLI